ncbi:MAG: enoyl-CoA hydratase/isomerase family protein [Xanthomonadaceae bacterium]|nr:enoyl-CoA hydratase/isomerase family protein [Xanthomonadaceae bacterium]
MTASTFTLENRSNTYGMNLYTLTFDLQGEKVNKFSRPVMEEMKELVTKLEEMGRGGKIDALVFLSGKPGNFIAGADIELIKTAKTPAEAQMLAEQGQAILNRWEDLPFPTVMGINGTCLGGGCELSLASTSIVMSNNPGAKIGLPEVLLGFVPGMGGCVRMPQKIGIAQAFDLILAGKSLSGERAYKTGLADAVLPKENFETSVCNWVKANLKLLKSGARIAKKPALGGAGGFIGTLLEKTPIGRAVIFSQARKSVMKASKGQYPAPLEVIKIIRETGTGYRAGIRGAWRTRAMKREAEGFGRMSTTSISNSLVSLFFITEGIKKATGLPGNKKEEVKPVTSAAVLGAGVMGGGIAQLFAEKDIDIRMKDLNNQALTLGVESANKIFKKQFKRRRISEREWGQKLSHIVPTVDYKGFQSTEVVVEAIVENIDIKKKVIAELEGNVRDHTVIASNTSSLSITKIGTALKHPERFVGMHFFNPVAKMPLIEVIRGDQTDDRAVATVFALSKQLGKMPIVVKDAPGFLVNRLLACYLNEAIHLMNECVPMEEIDAAMEKFGMPMGPIELIDEVGVDVGEKVSHILNDAFGDRLAIPGKNEKLVEKGRLGKKSKKGLYRYEGEADKLKKFSDPETLTILGIKPKSGSMKPEMIVERCVYPMINEATRCLDEKIVYTPDDIDLGMIMGTGFPPFRGGLMRYADTVGAAKIVAALEKYASSVNKARFTPCESLVKRAKNNERFYS